MLNFILAAAAAAVTPGLKTPVPIRYELVYEVARVICPQTHGDRTIVEIAARRMALTDDETVSLYNHCILYAQGKGD